MASVTFARKDTTAEVNNLPVVDGQIVFDLESKNMYMDTSNGRVGMGTGDMLRSVYDTNNNGIVDNSERLGGRTSDNYQLKTDETLQTNNKTVVGAINELNTNTGVWIGAVYYSSPTTEIVVEDSHIKGTSIIEVYYNNSFIEAVNDVGVTYAQTTGKLTITLGSALTQYTTAIQLIANIKVVNP